MIFGTNNTQRLRITSGGHVNIGGNYTQTTDKLQVDGTIRGNNLKASAAIYADANANTSLHLHSTGTTGTSRIFLGDASTFQAGKIVYDHTNDYMMFGTGGNGAERLRIDSSGRVIITNDSVTHSTGTNTQYAPLVVRGNTSATSSRAAFINFARSEASANIAVNEGIGEIWFGDQQAGEYGAIKCIADGTAAVGDYPGRLNQMEIFGNSGMMGTSLVHIMMLIIIWVSLLERLPVHYILIIDQMILEQI
jgi:hypothetical protein